MPTTGASMTYKIIPKGLPGYEDYHAIQITYNMSSGIQDKRHPYPGSPYYAIGTDRVLYNVTPPLSWWKGQNKVPKVWCIFPLNMDENLTF